jgi:hypothetical protein
MSNDRIDVYLRLTVDGRRLRVSLFGRLRVVKAGHFVRWWDDSGIRKWRADAGRS